MVRRSISLRFLSLAIMIARSATFVVCPRTGEGSAVRLCLASTKSNEMESLEKEVEDEDVHIKQTNLFINKLIEQHESQLKKVEADKIELIKAKDEIIKTFEADKIELIKAKDELKKAKDELVKAKDELIRFIEYRWLKTEAELSKMRAKYEVEWNLRPLLELLITQWCNTYSDVEDLSSTKAFEEFARKQGDEIYKKFYKPIVVRKMGSLQWRSKAKFIKQKSELFPLFSKNLHNARVLQNLSPDIKGFVVYGDLQFSSVVSSIMMYFQIPHTVMSKDCTNVVYTWYG